MHLSPNIWKQPISLGQLQKGEKWEVEAPMVAAVDAPGVTEADLVAPFEIQYSS